MGWFFNFDALELNQAFAQAKVVRETRAIKMCLHIFINEWI
jgi:hypothetical protein